MKVLVTRFPLVLLLLFGSSCLFRGHPSDTELKKLFHEHRDHFERVRVMLSEDATMTRIDPSFLHATGRWDTPTQKWIEDEKISSARWDEYRRLFRKTHAAQGVAAEPARESVSFLISSEGLSIGGSSKGIVWMSSPPGNLVGTLDRPERPGKAGASYVCIEGQWYIYYSWMN